MPTNGLPEKTDPPSDVPNQTDHSSDTFNSMRWMSYGLELAGVIGIFTYGGYKLDEKLQTLPWLMIAGFFIGFVGMMYLLWKELRNIR
ncbi:MAG: AtpZ/AtpI family protein [Sedimentisphaerales bacterium]|nr:AtpZ/AtpI family protein [Sedimentisphaerales bacterium]